MNHERPVAVKDCTAAADTLEALDIYSLSLTVNDCSIPISSVAHVVASPQALLSEEEAHESHSENSLLFCSFLQKTLDQSKQWNRHLLSMWMIK